MIKSLPSDQVFNYAILLHFLLALIQFVFATEIFASLSLINSAGRGTQILKYKWIYLNVKNTPVFHSKSYKVKGQKYHKLNLHYVSKVITLKMKMFGKLKLQ